MVATRTFGDRRRRRVRGRRRLGVFRTGHGSRKAKPVHVHRGIRHGHDVRRIVTSRGDQVEIPRREATRNRQNRRSISQRDNHVRKGHTVPVVEPESDGPGLV